MPMLTKKIAMVIADNSGTTNDEGVYAPAVVFIRVFDKWKTTISMEEARKPMGLHKRDHIEAILKTERLTNLFREVYGRDWTQKDVEAMFADFMPMQMACLPEYSKLIPGTKETVDFCRKKFGVIFGSTTGFFKEANDKLLSDAKRQGYCPDVFISASEVPKARPYWHMVEANMKQAGIIDPEVVLKIGDTMADMQEAKALKKIGDRVPWTLGFAATGNYVGKNREEIKATPGDVLLQETERAAKLLHKAGADYVVNDITGLPRIIEQINERLAREERPREIPLDYLD